MKKRYLFNAINEDLNHKMIFIGGPRQVGKTTMAKEILNERGSASAYYNWDYDLDRKALMKGIWPTDGSLVVLDEIHKYSRWKNWIKGHYDKHNATTKFLVTGSAKLNVYRKKGDSLLGRYHYYCLHPFSYRECLGNGSEISESLDITLPFHFSEKEDYVLFETLLKFGGFPEPFLKNSERFSRRWHQERVTLLVKEDIRSLEDVKDLSQMLMMAESLKYRAGNLLSINAIREDLEVAHKTVDRWLTILEMVYYCYRIYPYHQSLSRALKKEPKLYLWDWSEVEDEGVRFENCLAGHLLKFADFISDCFGFKCRVCYVRTLDKKEVDFLVLLDKKPWFAVEAKLSDTTPSKTLKSFQEKLQIPNVYQVIKTPNYHASYGNLHVVSASKFLSALV